MFKQRPCKSCGRFLSEPFFPCCGYPHCIRCTKVAGYIWLSIKYYDRVKETNIFEWPEITKEITPVRHPESLPVPQALVINNNFVLDGHKRCRDCPEILPATKEYFPPYKSSSDGLLYKCYDCYNLKQNQRRTKNRDEINRKRRLKKKFPNDYKEILKEPLETNRTCEGCVINKSINEFRANGKKKDGSPNYTYKCKKCISKLDRERRNKDPILRLAANFRFLTNKALSRGKKSNTIGSIEGDKFRYLEYIGCTVPQLMEHLERQFQSGMTWQNHGLGPTNWNMDHTIPLSSAKTKEDVYVLSNYKNLQPLWRWQNFAKSDKMLEELFNPPSSNAILVTSSMD